MLGSAIAEGSASSALALLLLTSKSTLAIFLREKQESAIALSPGLPRLFFCYNFSHSAVYEEGRKW
jgi:hypothetical protein